MQKLIATLCVLELMLLFSPGAFSQKRKTREQNKREADSLSGILIKQLQGDKKKMLRDVKQLKESLKSLETIKEVTEDSLEKEIELRNDSIVYKNSIIQKMETYLEEKSDTIRALCIDTTNYGIHFRDLEKLSQEKDDWTQKQTAAVEEHRKTVEALRTTFTELENFMTLQKKILQHENDSLKNFIQLHLQQDSIKNKSITPPK